MDVYGLGATLYALLTGRPPFLAATMLVTLEQVCSREPVAPRHLQPTVPRDLETICLKCLAKDPRRRYADAEALADDLDRFLEGRPIVARPAGTGERLAKWVRRRPGVAALLALVFLLLVGGLAAVSWQWRQTEQARREASDIAVEEQKAHQKALDSADEERKARAEADARRQEADRERHRSQAMSAGLALDQGIRLCEDGKVGPGLLWMARALELTPAGEADLDYTARANLSAWRGEFCPSRRSNGQGTAVLAVAISPDGKTVLTGDLGNVNNKPGPARAQLWDAATWKPLLAQPVTHPSAILSVAFSPDGLTFATGSFDGTIRRWQTATGAPVGPPLEHGGPVYSIAFSRDGAALAGGGWHIEGWEKRSVAGTRLQLRGGEVRVWETAMGRPTGGLLRLAGMLVRAVAWAPDGRSLAVGGYFPAALGKMPLQGLLPSGADRAAVGGMALVCDMAAGKVLGPQMLHADAVTAVAFHPEGKVLATACADGVVRQWDARTRLRQGPQLRHPDAVNALAFSRDGRVIATGSGSVPTNRSEARLWDTATGQLLVQPLVHRFVGHWDKIHAVALSFDGTALATASENGQAYLWDIAGAPTSQAALPSPHPNFSLAFSPDGRTLLMSGQGRAADQPGELRLFDARTGLPTGVVLSPRTWVMPPRFSPDGARLLAVSHRDSKKYLLRLWETATGREIQLPAAVAQGVTWASFSADGKTLWTGGSDGKLRPWEAITFTPCGEPLDHGQPIREAALSPDGRRALTGSLQSGRLWALPEGKPIGAPLWQGEQRGDLRFTADSRVIMVVRQDFWCNGSCSRYSAADGRLLGPPEEVPLPESLRIGDLHPDGRSFLSLRGNDYPAHPWDSFTGQPRGMSAPFPTSAVAFHPSGRFVALVGSESVRLWSLETGKPIGPALPHPLSVGVAFHPGGHLLATWSGQDQAARLWKVADPVAGSPAEVKRRVEALTGQELDEAGNPRELKPEEWKNRRQQVERLAPWKP